MRQTLTDDFWGLQKNLNCAFSLTNRKYSFKNPISVETGLIDHHHLIYSMLKTAFLKEEPKTLIYRDYKTFCLEAFISELFATLKLLENIEFQTSGKIFVDTLNNQAPKELKIFRGNQKLHLNKTLRNATMKHSKSADDLI